MQSIPSCKELQEGALLLIDKPLKWTSFDVVKRLRKPIGAKIGHCGTLDPLATGLLILCTGKMTKQIQTYMGMPKEYTGIIHLGARTPTYDLESEPQDFKDFTHITQNDLQNTAASFTGLILQTPPIHSAIKTDGKRAYELARAGEEVQLKSRQINIMEFELTHIDLPEVHFRVSCSTGTYIRSLANDFGAALGCGGYLQQLRRTRIGSFHVDNAYQPMEVVQHLKAEKSDLKSGAEEG